MSGLGKAKRLQDSNLGSVRNAFPESLTNLCLDLSSFGNVTPPSVRSTNNSSPSLLGTRSSPYTVDDDDEPAVLCKRRKMNSCINDDMDAALTPQSTGSPRDSPLGFYIADHSFDADLGLVAEGGTVIFDDTLSNMSTPSDSPATFQRKQQAFRGKLKKEALWPAIQSNYQFLMDEEIIETCKSTESDLSWESDDLSANTNVSLADFMQQYRELTEWLEQIQRATHRHSSSLSERYLTQTYHEEMMQRSSRRKVFNDTARQLMRRHPQRKEEVSAHVTRLNQKWAGLEATMSPHNTALNTRSVLRDLEQDLAGLRGWLHEVEESLLHKVIDPNWDKATISSKLHQHKTLQNDIESHSKVVSSVLKLCERLQATDCSLDGTLDSSLGGADHESLQLVAENLERRWHGIWLQSLEWQCRLEEALTSGKVRQRFIPVSDDDEEIEDDDVLPGYQVSHNTDTVKFSTAECATEPTYHTTTSTDTGDDGLESDASNFDVIPFSESEYEKINVDTDANEDDIDIDEEDSVDISPRFDRYHSDEGPHKGTDSALGRSVSDDHSINSELAAALSSGRLPGDHVNPRVVSIQKAVQCVKSSGTKAECDMKAAQETDALSLAPPRTHDKACVTNGNKNESHDVGYSSESHSNDEPDSTGTNNSNIILANGYGLQDINQNSQEAGLDEGQPLLDNVVYRKNKGASSEGGESSTSPVHRSKKNLNQSWRHSMTSAYDTSSNCSEVNSPYDLDVTLEPHTDVTIEEDGISPERDGEEDDEISEKDKVENMGAHYQLSNLISSPSQRFYQMTAIETDSEATSLTDNRLQNYDLAHDADDSRDGGAATDAESELSKSLELPYDSTPLKYDPSCVPLPDDLSQVASDLGCSILPDDVSSPEQVVPQTPAAPNVVAANEVSDTEPTSSADELTAYDSNYEGHALFEFESWTKNKSSKRSDSLAVQVDSESSNHEAGLSESSRTSTPNAVKAHPSVSRLMRQAELMTRDSDLLDLTTSNVYQERRESQLSSTSNSSRKRRSRRRRRALKEAAAAAKTSENILSVETVDKSVSGKQNNSCDASSEGTTSGSETETDFSTASSDPDETYDSMILMQSGTTGSSRISSKQHSAIPGSNSAYELYKMSRTLEAAQYSISEGAINDIKSHRSSRDSPILCHKLRRTASEATAIPFSPGSSRQHRRRRRRLKRAVSDDLSYSPPSTHSPSPPKVIISPHSTPKSCCHSTQDPCTHSRSHSPCDVIHRPVAMRTTCGSNLTSKSMVAKAAATSCAMPVPTNQRHITSESDLDPRSTAARLTVCGPEGETDTDHLAHSINSAVDSFSEHAWDPYQDAPYPSVSEDPDEEKLDSSRLQGDWEGDFEEDGFSFDEPIYGAAPTRLMLPVTDKSTPLKPREKRLSSTKISTPSHLMDSSRTLEDSDSDLEDFHMMVEDSCKALQFTETTLKKFRKDNMETGIYLDPNEYVEPLATCQCQIKCLEEVLSIAESEAGIQEQDIQHVQDVINQWQQLHQLCRRRQQQSAQLSSLHKDLNQLKSDLTDIASDLDSGHYDDMHQLETAVKALQERKTEMCREHQQKMISLCERVCDVERLHPDLNMTRFNEEVTQLQRSLDSMIDRSAGRVPELQSALFTWYDFNESRRELEYLLHQEHHQVAALGLTQHGDVTFNPTDLKRILNDLQIVQQEMEKYETTLSNLHQLHSNLSSVCSERLTSDLGADLARCRHDLDTVRRLSHTLRSNVSDHLTAKVEASPISMSSVAVQADSSCSAFATNDECCSTGSGTSLFWRLLKAVLPVKLVLLALIALMYLLDPNWADGLGLVVSPQLRYVRGPPPF